jgi:cbb3-type cytochrome c oxidase subunit II
MKKLNFQKNLGVFIAFIVVVFSFAVLTTYLIPMFSLKSVTPDADARPYSALEAQGRQLYMSEGCVWCHSQIVRQTEGNVTTFFRRGDIGNITDPGWYAYQNPTLMEQHRRGPDLSHVWSRWPSEFWQATHLKDPRGINPDSWMPSFRYLSEDQLNSLMAYLETLK